MGMKIETLSRFFTYESDVTLYHNEILELLANQKQIIEEQILLQQENLNHVNQKIAYFTSVHEAIQQQSPIPTWDDYIYQI